jgi:hypothetical protein
MGMMMGAPGWELFGKGGGRSDESAHSNHNADGLTRESLPRGWASPRSGIQKALGERVTLPNVSSDTSLGPRGSAVPPPGVPTQRVINVPEREANCGCMLALRRGGRSSGPWKSDGDPEGGRHGWAVPETAPQRGNSIPLVRQPPRISAQSKMNWALR